MLQNYKMKARGGAQRGGYINRGRYNPGYSGYRGRGYGRMNNPPQQDLLAVLASALQQVQPQPVPSTSGATPLQRTNIAAQK